jgi:hypothetical protein
MAQSLIQMVPALTSLATRNGLSTSRVIFDGFPFRNELVAQTSARLRRADTMMKQGQGVHSLVSCASSWVEKAVAPLVQTCPSLSMVSGSALMPLVDNTPLRRMRESAPCACELLYHFLC